MKYRNRWTAAETTEIFSALFAMVITIIGIPIFLIVGILQAVAKKMRQICQEIGISN